MTDVNNLRDKCVIAAIMLIGLCGCQSGPPPRVFGTADTQGLAALCVAPPCPIGYSEIRYRSTGHLKEVLANRTFIGAQEYLDLMLSADPGKLRNRAALVVLEHKNSHVSSGLMILLFDSAATLDVFTAERMIRQSETPEEHLQPADIFPFHWNQTDGEQDFVQDMILHIDLGTTANLVDAQGQPQYLWRWGGP